jgi:hypothetical protein
MDAIAGAPDVAIREMIERRGFTVKVIASDVSTDLKDELSPKMARLT